MDYRPEVESAIENGVREALNPMPWRLQIAAQLLAASLPGEAQPHSPKSALAMTDEELNRKCAELLGYESGVPVYETLPADLPRPTSTAPGLIIGHGWRAPNGQFAWDMPQFASSAFAAMVLLDEMVLSGTNNGYYFTEKGYHCYSSATGQHYEGKPSAVLPRMIAETYLLWKSNMQENKV